MTPTGIDDSDRFTTVDTGPEIEIKVRGSRFLGQAFRADSEDEAAARRDEVRRRHHDATHHVWARRVGPPEACVERADDDGEPSGTGGAPMLAVLQGAALYDALVVVTRWFGGTKLGRGGLARAYSDAARAALEAAPKRTVWRETTMIADCEYDVVGAVEAVLAREGEHIRRCDRDFSGRPRFAITVLRSQTVRLLDILREATAGRVEFRRATLDE